MVEWTALEMRRTLTGTLGSNPSLSARKGHLMGVLFAMFELVSASNSAGALHLSRIPLKLIEKKWLSMIGKMLNHYGRKG